MPACSLLPLGLLVASTETSSSNSTPLTIPRDSDGDGAPDGVEDEDRDGQVDLDESDPRISGLFPGHFPHIPEPMIFDLVRGLASRQGEVEVELPMTDRELRALELADQVTLPSPARDLRHGVQIIAECLLTPRQTGDRRCVSGVGLRLGRFSALAVLVVPQVHLQRTKHGRVQLGGGLALESGETYPMPSTRLVLE